MATPASFQYLVWRHNMSITRTLPPKPAEHPDVTAQPDPQPSTRPTCPTCGLPLTARPCTTCYSPRIVENRGGEPRAWMPIELADAMATALAAAEDAKAKADAAVAAPADEARSAVITAVGASTPDMAERTLVGADPGATLALKSDTDNADATVIMPGTAAELANALPEPDIVGDADASIAGHDDPHSLTLLQMKGPARAGLPSPDDLPPMPAIPEGTRLEPGFFERWRADKLGIDHQEMTCRNALLRLLGITDYRALDAPARAALRLEAKRLAGMKVSVDEAEQLIFDTFVEVAVEKRRAAERESKSEELQQGRAWFVLAGMLHMVVLLALWSLVMLAFPEKEKKKTLGLAVSADAVSSPYMAPSPATSDLPPADSPIDRNDPEIPEVDIPDQLRTPDMPPMPSELNRPEPVAPPSLALPKLPDSKLPGLARSGLNASSDGSPEMAGGMLGNRNGSGRRTALRRHGGSAGTETAVNAGLEWLHRVQRSNGSWLPDDSPNNMRYYAEGYTSLALLCFLGAGHVPGHPGIYRETVDKAVAWLLERQNQRNGLFGRDIMGAGYNQTVTTLALAEAYAMNRDANLRRAVIKGLEWLYDAQQPSGGWDYNAVKVQNRTDTSITGWAVMAMKSAMIGGIDVDRHAWDEAHRAIIDLTTETGEVLYSRNGTIYPGRRGVGMCAVGLLCRLYWGEHDGSRTFAGSEVPVTSIDKTLAWVTRNPPSERKLHCDNSPWNEIATAERANLPTDDEFFHTVYYWYYGTLSLFSYTGGEGEKWNNWNREMQSAVLPFQHTDRNDPDSYGSWDVTHPFWGLYSGQLYVTCLNILNLEIYYRYLPLYSNDGKAVLPGKLVDHDKRPKANDPAPSSTGGNGNGNSNPGIGNGTPAPQPPARPDVTTSEGAIDALKDPLSSGGEKSKAIKTLKDTDTGDARTALADVLLTPVASEFTRWEAIKALGDMGAVDQWVRLRAAYRLDFNRTLKPMMLEYMGKIEVTECFDFLLGEMKKGNEDLKSGAAKGLANLTGKQYGPDPGPWEAYRNRAIAEDRNR